MNWMSTMRILILEKTINVVKGFIRVLLCQRLNNNLQWLLYHLEMLMSDVIGQLMIPPDYPHRSVSGWRLAARSPHG